MRPLRTFEPSLRRRWPRVLVGWSRLLLGRFNDPLVGRDMLTGVVIGLLWNLTWRGLNLAPVLFGLSPLVPYGPRLEALSSLRGALFRFFSIQHTAVLFALGAAFILLIWHVVTRRRNIAIIAAAATYFAISYPTVTFWRSEHMGFVLAFAMIVGCGIAAILMRFGLLSLALAIFVHFQLAAFPLTVDVSSWYAGRSAVAIALLLAMAAYGAFAASERPVVAR